MCFYYSGESIWSYTASKKKKARNVFFVISPIKLWRFWWNLVYRFLDKFASKWYKRFSPHLNSVSTLPCETWNAPSHMLPLSCYRRSETNSRIYPTSTVASKFDHIWIQLIRACGKCCKRRCTKHTSLLWSYQRRHWRMASTVTT